MSEEKNASDLDGIDFFEDTKVLDFYTNHWDRDNPTCPRCEGAVAENTRDLTHDVLRSGWRYRGRTIWACPHCKIYFRIEVEQRYMLNFTPRRLEKTVWGNVSKDAAIPLLTNAISNRFCEVCSGAVGHTQRCDGCVANPNVLRKIIKNYLI